jgi:membrane protein implicated in regulation of membrane protease activity
MVDLFGVPLSLLLLLAGSALIVAEALAPGAHFIVVGVGLLAAGIVGILLGGLLGALTPLVLALVVVVAGGATLGFYRKLGVGQGGIGSKTSDSASLRGQTGRVTERITRNGGEVKLDDGGFNPYYRARTMDGIIEEGAEVMVLDPGGGNVVTVESLDGLEDDIDRELARERARRERENDADDDGETEPA